MSQSNKHITGFLLVGGRGTRFGSAKHRIRLGRESLYRRNLRLLRAVCAEVGVIANENQAGERWRGVRVHIDLRPRCGPLGGIYTGLRRSRTQYNLFLACDLPFLTRPALELLRRRCAGYEVTLPAWSGQVEPLCAVYSRSCLGAIEAQLDEANFRIVDVLPRLKVRSVRDDLFAGGKRLFFNINTPRQLLAARRLRGRRFES